jgi:glutathione peroxidase
LTSFYDFSAARLDGAPEAMAAYRGKVVLVVNVASKCGNTPQYEGLEKLWRDFSGRGLVVLGFPCNQFGGQEPGSAADIQQFCSLTYDVTFPMFEKVEVNGANAHPLYRWLKAEAPGAEGGDIEWNFAKFLIDREGRVAERFAPGTLPQDIAGNIEALL